MEALFYKDGKPINIKIKGNKIIGIERNFKQKDEPKELIYVAPGFIDHQINGYLSHSFVGDDLSEEKVKKIMLTLYKNGITTFLPTLTTESNKVLLRNFKVLNQILKNNFLAQSIPGFHLEGPYISPVDEFRGAHNIKHVRKPNWQEFKLWNQASGNRIIEVTIAPEVEGAMDFIHKCKENNINVALGHTNASSEQISKAVDLGATISTHLGNGCANFIHRHNNPIWPQLSEDKLYASIIVDGFHLTKEEVKTFFKAKGADKIILVSDITRLAGMPPGFYVDFDKKVEVTEMGAIMMPTENVLAGASRLLNRNIENMIAYTDCCLADAIDMCTKNPAQALGLTDRGVIDEGKRADLVYFKYSLYKLEVVKTVVGGKVVFESNTKR